MKKCKYCCISMDSTRDISHVDQLSFIVRYVLQSGPVERFVKFLRMKGQSAEQLLQSLLTFLRDNRIDLNDRGGQSYVSALT